MKKENIIAYFIIVIQFLALMRCDKDTNKPEPAKLPFVIENLGVTFGDWDRETNCAGDFYFNHDFQKVFSEFGAQVLDPDWNIKELPTFDYVIRNDAFVFAIAEGEVAVIDTQRSSGDYEISIRSLNDPSFSVYYDHLVNIRISVGDKIQPGDTLGNARPFTSEIGSLEIMVNNTDTKLSYCPFCFFNEDKLDDYTKKVSRLMRDWEEFKGDSTIYDESEYVFPGCRYESMLSY
ncbi:hypothetical protein JXB12_05990 [candidate division KSB1 bacterium]|nr:hypothetical protein [candidate division KSB1 bacterium]